MVEDRVWRIEMAILDHLYSILDLKMQTPIMNDTNNATRLLPGFRVLDLTSSMGAFCGKLLRDLGMDVIEVEPPGGYPTRSEPPFAKGHAHPEGSLRFAYLNAGKRSITLDITKDSGRGLLLDSVERADIVLESFEPGYLSAHDLGYEVLLERRPEADPGFPHRLWSRRALRSLQDAGYRRHGDGWIALHQRRSEADTVQSAGNAILLLCQSLAAYGTMLALWQRETRGIGAYVDASIQASMALHEHVAFNYSAEGRVMKRAGSQHQHNAPANLFQCKNGWIALFVTRIIGLYCSRSGKIIRRSLTIRSGSTVTCGALTPTTSMRR